MLVTLILGLPLVYSVNLSFPLLRDSPLKDDPLRPEPYTARAKTFLKNRLLDNLNSFFGSETTETLEILDSHPQRIEEDLEIPPSMPIVKPTDIPSMKSGGKINKRMDSYNYRYPTLIPTEAPGTLPTESPLITTTAMSKNRAEGRMLSEKSIDSIREWRKRLYKAFKWKKAKDLDSGSQEKKYGKKDKAIEKNRQIIESRREPPSHMPTHHYQFTNNGRLLGSETGGGGFKAAAASSQVASHPVPLPDHQPLPPAKEFSGKRQAIPYRTPNHSSVVYLPAPQPQAPTYNQPHVSHHLVTATAPSLLTLPPMITFQAPSPVNLFEEYQLTTSATPAQQFHSLPSQQTRFSEEIQSEDEMFGPPVAMNTDCQDGMCQTASNGQIVSEEKCNSNRLRTIIQNNIVANDAEASKRAVQMAAESETGSFFDAVCGTGFFSYIAHTDEFCLASSAGVNCYVFSPVCADSGGGGGGGGNGFGFRRRAATRKKVLLNRN